MNRDLENLAAMLMASGTGILAADETVPTLTKRFDSLGIPSTEQSRRTYRQMLFGSPGAADFISGAIMPNETIRQKSADGRSLVEMQTAQGMVPGMKVDTGANPLAESCHETVTEGLDRLRDRLSEYRSLGARFAKMPSRHPCHGRLAEFWLQDPALEAWHGRDENPAASQQALYHRARLNGAARIGKYGDEMEAASPAEDDPPHRRDWRDA